MQSSGREVSEASIATQELSKRYPGANRLALDKLTLSVYPGEVYGFLGPNGAGKSTTIRLLMNFIQPTSGQATILGDDIVKDSVRVKKSVGYLGGEIALYSKMTGQQFLDYMGALQPPVSQTYVKELIKRLQADPRPRLGELSKGNRQKFGLIQAFMHQPKVLILDEPTSGLDPLMQEVFYELIREVKGRGAALFASSHILGEVQKMCDRVGIIREGRLVGERTIADMLKEAAHTFEITFADSLPLAALKKIPGVQVANHHGTSVTLHIQGVLAPLFAELSKHRILAVNTRNLDLEEVFLSFYKHKGEQS